MDCSLSLRRSSPRSQRPALLAEHLEARITPAAKAPVLTFTVVQMNDPNVVITGRVTGTYTANSTVAFTGAVTHNLTTDSLGNFSFTLPANNLGTVTGVAWNTQGQQSNVLNRQVTSLPPAFTSFTATVDENLVWTFSGQISNENLYNQTITFSGLTSLEGQTTTTTSTGSFVFQTTLGEGETGTVYATVNDCWNLTGSASVAV